MILDKLAELARIGFRDGSANLSDVSGTARVSQGAYAYEGEQREAASPTGDARDLKGWPNQEQDQQGLEQRTDHDMVHRLSTKNEHPAEHAHAGDVGVQRGEREDEEIAVPEALCDHRGSRGAIRISHHHAR